MISRRIGLDTEPNQEGAGQQDEGDMARPADRTAHFILIESEVFAGFDVLFDVPAAANRPHDGRQRRGWERKDQVGGDLAGIVEAATKDEEVAVVHRALVHDGQDGPREEPLAFGALALREELPVLGAQRLLDAGDIGQHAPVFGLDTDDFDGGDGQGRRVALLLQEEAQVGAVAVDRLGDDPTDRQTGLVGPLDHELSEFGFGAEGQRRGDVRGEPAGRIAAPLLRHIQFAVDQAMAYGRDVGEENADLAVFHPSAHPARLGLDAR